MGRQVTISKLDHSGRRLASYPGTVIQSDEWHVVARCRWEMPRTVDLGDLTFVPGDTLIEYYYRDQAFNIFVVYDTGGTLKGFYCNVLERTVFSEDTIEWADLALDLVVTPDGRQAVHDQDEFEALNPTPEQRRRSMSALNTLNEWVIERREPFEHIHERKDQDE